MSASRLSIALVFCFILSSTLSWGADVPATVSPPGQKESFKSKALELGAELLQRESPVRAIAIYLDGFHFHSGDMGQQVEAHHFCTQVNEDFIQCVIYNGNGRDALLMGVEYVISARLFETLPMEERKLWHSHHYEVKSGQLIAPGIPGFAERELMEKLVSTYGKTWHTWKLDKPEFALPLGIPELMMGFTADGQADPDLVGRRDKRFGISADEKKKARADIPMPNVLPGANAWETGSAVRLQRVEVPAGKGRERAPESGEASAK